MEKPDTKILSIIGILVIIPISIILDGFVVATLYRWFIAATFNLPFLTIPNAIGISLLINSFKTIINEKSNKSINEAISTIILKPILYLIFGYVITLFI